MFDVVLSDGRLKTKCVLAPKMNHLVRTGKLAAHSILRGMARSF
uniref:Uncharacterized protein n=1 Tax=Globisporangium ultimum (strain ATCC 200006 / CBS 805.95 / DAOM BR144) TaxID=431595 RepID=K3X6Z7_GLOUD